MVAHDGQHVDQPVDDVVELVRQMRKVVAQVFDAARSNAELYAAMVRAPLSP